MANIEGPGSPEECTEALSAALQLLPGHLPAVTKYYRLRQRGSPLPRSEVHFFSSFLLKKLLAKGTDALF